MRAGFRRTVSATLDQDQGWSNSFPVCIQIGPLPIQWRRNCIRDYLLRFRDGDAHSRHPYWRRPHDGEKASRPHDGEKANGTRDREGRSTGDVKGKGIEQGRGRPGVAGDRRSGRDHADPRQSRQHQGLTSRPPRGPLTPHSLTWKHPQDGYTHQTRKFQCSAWHPTPCRHPCWPQIAGTPYAIRIFAREGWRRGRVNFPANPEIRTGRKQDRRE